MSTVAWLAVALWACRPDPIELEPGSSSWSTPEEPLVDTSTTPPIVPTLVQTDLPEVRAVRDVAVESGYVDATFGGVQRGRAAVAFDVDGDDDLDTFLGNPNGTSYVLTNVTPPGGPLAFEPGQVLATGIVMWGGTAGDLDNDGDAELYVTVGGNERDGIGLDALYENVDGVLENVSNTANIWPREARGNPFRSFHASAFFWDMDGDALLDVFVNGSVVPPSRVGDLVPEDLMGLNRWLRNQGELTFVDEAPALGITTQWQTRNSNWIDYDNDGDADLYENNYIGPNVMWRNDGLDADGHPIFTDVTATLGLAGSDLSYPRGQGSQAAFPVDLNQDGWEDMVVTRRNPREAGEPAVHSDGHLVWINVAGQGFVEVGDASGINADWTLRDHDSQGVMGCNMADLTADGIADLFVGNGSPEGGAEDALMVSVGLGTLWFDDVGMVTIPIYMSWSHLVDFPSEQDALDGIDRYPYRTHGSYFADMDGDGLLELMVHNGGPSILPDMEEPNRLFVFDWETRPHWLRVRPTGDGVRFNRDGIGARVRAKVQRPDGTRRWVHATRRGATGFGAQNDPDVFLGLGDATEVLELIVEWPRLGEQRVRVEGVDLVIDVPLEL